MSDAPDPADLRLASYDYPLDPGAIAQVPAAVRHGSRLLTLGRAGGEPVLGAFPDFLVELGRGDCLVRNVTRVDRARLLGRRAGGGAFEALVLGPWGAGAGAGLRLRAMVRPSAKVKPGARVDFGGVEATVGERLPGGERELHFADAAALERAREAAGELPLPPYITSRAAAPERYQTVYAARPGSVAAPTAGLHFEAGDFEALAARGVEVVDVCLDVGPGTFQPVRAEDLREHRMHPETFRIDPGPAARLAAARAAGRRIVAVGTTAMRVLESLPDRPGWEAGLESSTALFIYPGFRFRMVDALLTNFHLPGSSLLMLVAAFAGRTRVLDAYGRALAAGFRVFSFGDAMWIR